MRIISGTHKGKGIIAPKSLPVRPTTDFAKEALFNILNNEFDISTIEVLDLFSGTGNIAYEFASRQAPKIRCIDKNFNCINFIKKTSANLHFSAIEVYKNDVFKYLKKYTQQFDIIFADPPYNLPNIDTISELVFKNNLLKPNGWLILEHDKKWNFAEYPHFLVHRNYGHVNFSIFRNPIN